MGRSLENILKVFALAKPLVRTNWNKFTCEDILFTGYFRAAQNITDIQILRDVCLHLNTDEKLHNLQEKVRKLEANELIRKLYDKKDEPILQFSPQQEQM